jgi:hypothetical protein
LPDARSVRVFTSVEILHSPFSIFHSPFAIEKWRMKNGEWRMKNDVNSGEAEFPPADLHSLIVLSEVIMDE